MVLLIIILLGIPTALFIIYNPIRIKYYNNKLVSSISTDKLDGANGLLSCGKDGEKALLDYFGSSSALSLFKKYWGKLNIIGGEYGTPLVEAIQNNEVKVVEIYIIGGASIDQFNTPFAYEPLSIACSNNNLKIVKLLIDHGAKINNCAKESNYIPIINAALGNSAAIVNYLLINGANPNNKDRHGDTPLNHAIYNNNYKMCYYLLTRNANPNIVDDEGFSSFSIVFDVMVSHLEETDNEIEKKLIIEETYYIAKQMIKNNLNMHLFNARDESPLVLVLRAACMYDKNFIDLMEYMLANGADPNIKNDCGNTPLHFLTNYNNCTKVAKILLKYGANPNIKNNNAESPKDICILRGDRLYLIDLFNNTFK